MGNTKTEFDLDDLFKNDPKTLELLKRAGDDFTREENDRLSENEPGDKAVAAEEKTDREETGISENVHETDKSEFSEKPNKGNRILNILLDILVYGFCLALIAGSTMFAFSNDTGKNLFGYRFYNVLTASMTPEFGVGDMIFIKLCDPENIQVGDIVTFTPSRSSTAYLTHRVVEIQPDEEGGYPNMVTKGDANNTNDPPISTAAVAGVYQFHIPKVGAAIQFIRENLVLMSICLVSTFILLVFLRSYFAARKETEVESVKERSKESENT